MEDKDKNVVFQPGAVVFQSGAIQVQSGANVQMGGTQTITQNFYNGVISNFAPPSFRKVEQPLIRKVEQPE